MTLQVQAAAAVGEWAQSHHPIVVAVDGSDNNRRAVAWAAAEATATGSEVVLLHVVEDHLLPTPHLSIRSSDLAAHDLLADARQGIQHVVDERDVRTEVVTGSPVEVILEASRDARMLVVGKRGLGSFARVLVGSTSIAVAGRAKVPVAIVPDDWERADHRPGPVVLGIDPHRPHHSPTHLAFSRARRLNVPLVAVHGWETPTLYSWDAGTVTGAVSQWEQEAHAEFDKVLDTWRERFPDVEVEAVHSHSHPAMAVLDAADRAQLLVLGRHTDGKLGGFAFGSVTRAVLHYSKCPVMVVPTEDSQSLRAG
jgi:nucleotide-binding universal stress UspA family protein